MVKPVNDEKMERLKNKGSAVPLLALSLIALAYPVGDEEVYLTEYADVGSFR